MKPRVLFIRLQILFCIPLSFLVVCVTNHHAIAQGLEEGIEHLSKEQLIKDYSFFGVDSLALFDFEKAYDIALHVEHIDIPFELKSFFYIEETKFVKAEYHIQEKPSESRRNWQEENRITTTCNNLDFEDGDFTGWNGSWGYNSWSGPVPPAIYNLAGVGINTLGMNQPITACAYHTLIDTAYGNDFYGAFPVPDTLIPGNYYCARLGGSQINLANFGCSTPDPIYSAAEVLSQTYVVTSSNALIEYNYAVVLMRAPHLVGENPYFHVEIFDSLGNSISPCLDYYIQTPPNSSSPPPGFFSIPDSTVYYLPWTQNSLNLISYIGQTVTVKFTASGCVWGAHWAYAYIDVNCASVQIAVSNGSCSGNAILTAPPVANGSYLWTGPGIVGPDTTQSINANVNGIYTVVVTYANGCSYTVSDSVTIGVPLSCTIAGYNPITCYGSNNGSASVSANSGTAPYTYSWNSSPSQNLATATGLAAGTYSVTVTDAAGCSTATTIILTQPSALNVNPSNTNVDCYGGNNGSATVVVNGGTPAYTYLWSPLGGNGITASNLTAGTYTVSVTDANGCILTSTTTITQPALLVANSSSVTNVFCNGGANGSTTVAVNGGIPSYSYLWSPSGGNGITANNLTAGTYTVLITDNNGCTITTTAIVTQPPVLAANGSAVANVLCSGGNNGSATVSVNGGTTPYAYLWSPSGGNGVTATNLIAGTYIVTATDFHGCTITATTVVTQPSLLIANSSALTSASCSGVPNGSATVIANGGTPGYSYLWLPSGGSAATASNLAAGTYTVTLTDSHGCTISSIVIITQPALLAANGSTLTTILCNGGNNGSATVAASGGTPGYTYLWLPSGGSGITASNLTAGSYTVSVTDMNGCTTISTAIITQPAILAANTSALTNVLCNGGNTGSAAVAANGGTPGYSYLWSPAGGSALIALNLSAGVYTSTVTDINGCSITSTVIITEPPVIAASSSIISNVSCYGGNNGSSTVSASGGTPPYTYLWLPSGGNTATANNLSSGIYSVTVSDANGCSVTSAVSVTQPNVLAAITNTLTSPSCNGGNDGAAYVIPNGGTIPYSFAWSPSGGSAATASNLSAGSYSVTVTDAEGCTVINAITINQPSAIALTVNGAATICINQSTTIFASPSGGTVPYTYLWSNGVTDSSQSVSPATTTNYSVVVTDAFGCSISQSVTIDVNPALNVNAIAMPQICFGHVASVSAVGSGGNGGPYSYSWSSGQSSSSFTDTLFSNTSYTVTITDGCSPPVEATANVIVNPIPTVGFTPINAEGCIPVSVHFTDTANSLSSCAYLWDFGDGTTSSSVNPSHIYYNPGQYGVSLTITSSQGCSSTLSETNVVTANALPFANFTVPGEIAINETAIVEFQNLSESSNSWLWDFGDNSATATNFNPSHNYVDTGVYTIQLISYSPALCPDTAYRTIKVLGEFAIFIPNSFTPNGDGINDGFVAKGVYIKDYDMWILDRWGAKIYHSTSLSQPWNGTYFDDGRLCQNDVYIYKIKAHDVFGIPHEFVGRVTLVR